MDFISYIRNNIPESIRTFQCSLLLILANIIFVPTASAALTQINGDTTGGATFDRPTCPGFTDVCVPVTTRGTADYIFESIQFQATVTGTYQVGTSTPGVSDHPDTHITLYEGAFDPSQPLLNAILANDDNLIFGTGFDSAVEGTLISGTTYFSVVSSFTNNGAEGTYLLFIQSPEPVITIEDLASSLASAGSTLNAGDFLSSLPLNGSHHRPLLSYHGLDSGQCVWANGDLGNYSNRHDAEVGLAEIGGCYDVIPGQLRLGVGIGKSFVDQDLIFDGDSDLDGEYVIVELDYQLPSYPVIASLTGLYGRWDADVNRAYLSGGTPDSSFGSTDLETYSIRGRLDWLNAYSVSEINFSPRIAVTIGHSRVDAYTESGGTLPASFNSRSHTSKELRFGVDAEKQMGNSTWLRWMLEGIHRFDNDDPALSGAVTGLTAFSLPGQDNESFWSRVGMELEHMVIKDLWVSASVAGATRGEDPTVSGGLNLRLDF